MPPRAHQRGGQMGKGDWLTIFFKTIDVVKTSPSLSLSTPQNSSLWTKTLAVSAKPFSNPRPWPASYQLAKIACTPAIVIIERVYYRKQKSRCAHDWDRSGLASDRSGPSGSRLVFSIDARVLLRTNHTDSESRTFKKCVHGTLLSLLKSVFSTPPPTKPGWDPPRLSSMLFAFGGSTVNFGHTPFFIAMFLIITTPGRLSRASSPHALVWPSPWPGGWRYAWMINQKRQTESAPTFIL